MVSSIITIIIIAAVIISVSYVSINYFKFGEVDPKQMLKDYGNKFENTKNLKLSYDFEMSMYSIFTIPKISIDFYKLDDDMKVITSVMGATSANYIKNGKTITCTEGSMSSLYPTSSSSLSCKLKSESDIPIKPKVNEELYNQTEVFYNGVKKIIGRDCDDFIIFINETGLNYIQNQIPLTGLAIQPTNFSSENKSYIYYEVCMDKSYGYLALLNITVSSYSKLSGKNEETNLMSMEATKVSTDVKESDLVIPVAFVISSINCKKASIRFNITTLQDIISPTISLSLSSYYQNISMYKNMEKMIAGFTYSIEMPIEAKVNSSYYSAKVCIGTDCQSDYCYISDYYPTYR